MNIEINTDSLEMDISRLSSQLSELVTSANNMYSCIDALNGMWDGAAHETFVRQVAVDEASFQNLTNHIGYLIECMTYAKKEYVECEQDVSTIISKIHC